MQKLRDEGFINTIGVSNFEIDDIERIYQETGEYPAINQIVYCPNDNVDLQREKLISFCKSRNIVVQAAMPFGGSEMAKLLTEQDRKRILQQNRKNQIVSVFGTKSAKHMTQNLSYIQGE